jgi:nitrite reductase/ring-hydroxylating ferredoxin subunit
MWETLFKIDKIDDNSLKAVTVNGTPLLVANIKGKIYATSLYCTHEQTDLSEGFIEKCSVICPAHFASFDLKTGHVVSGPEDESSSIDNLKSYPTKVENGTIMVELP